MRAAAFGHSSSMPVSILDARDHQGRTPLAVAVGEVQREIVELLESRGATEW